MNPRHDLEEADPLTARGFVQLFIQHGNLFQFAIDGRNPEDEELRTYIINDDFEHDGDTTIGVTAINMDSEFDELYNHVEEMGFEIVDHDAGTETSEEIGEYRYQRMTMRADPDAEYEWDVPHLIIYGSLSPELEEACYTAFGHQYNYENIRNHAVVWGDELTHEDATTLHDTVGTASGFFEEDRRDVQSWISTADFI